MVNTQQTITGDFTRNPDLVYPGDNLRGRLLGALGPENVDFIDATRIATRLLGDSIASNLFLGWLRLATGPGAAVARGELLDGLNNDNHELAVSIASIPDHIRGFGHIKLASIEAARVCQADLLAEWPASGQDKAAA